LQSSGLGKVSTGIPLSSSLDKGADAHKYEHIPLCQYALKRALSVEFLRCGQPDPAVAAGDKDILVR
jgi:hypothetical protein